MSKRPSLPFIGFLQATGLTLYIILLSSFFNFIAPNMNNIEAQFYGPILMLLLFVISAVISGLLFLGRAGFLFWEKRYPESFVLVGWTVAWGIFYIVLFIMILSWM